MRTQPSRPSWSRRSQPHRLRGAARSWPAATTRTWCDSTRAPASRSAPTGVGTKLVLAEKLGRWDSSSGLDCVAMNVNDVVCAGGPSRSPWSTTSARRPRRSRDCPRDRRRACRPRGRARRIEIVGGELAQLGRDRQRFRGKARRRRLASDSLVTGASIEPGDAAPGLPSSGLHSNGYTLARSALEGSPSTTTASGGHRVAASRADRDLRAAGRRADALGRRRPGSRPHHLGRPRQPALPRGGRRVEIDDPLPVPAVFDLSRSWRGQRRGDARSLQHGLRLLRDRRGRGRGSGPERLREDYPAAKRIGRAAEGHPRSFEQAEPRDSQRRCSNGPDRHHSFRGPPSDGALALNACCLRAK